MKHWFILGALIAASALWTSAEPSGPPIPRADHHIHIRSEAATDALVQIQKKLGKQVSDSIKPATSADDVINLLDAAQIKKATLLSVAYFFGMPEIDFADEYAKVRAENNYVARQAAQYPDRLVAFFSVNPLADYALDEIERCARDPRMTGLKLHFANSDVDLRDSSDVQRIAKVFATANRLDLPIVVHLWTRNPDYGRKDAEIFIREVLAEAPDVPVQIAHLAGPGPFRTSTERASQAFVEAIENGAAIMDDVFFDIAAVTVNPEGAKGDSAQLQRVRHLNRKVARRIRELGTDRVLFGSDWIGGSPSRYTKRVQSLPLEEEVAREISYNVAPYFQ